MKEYTLNFIHWLPRVLMILVVLFISVFALDVFSMGGGPGKILVGLIMHLIPSLIMLTGLLIAWRRPMTGAAAFLALALIAAGFLDGFMGPLLSATFLFVGLFFALDGYARDVPPAN